MSGTGARHPSDASDASDAAGGPGRRALEVGWVASAHGIRGALKLRAHNRASDAWAVGVRLWIHVRGRPDDGAWYELASVSDAPPDHVRATLVGVEGRDAAETLRGRTVVVDRSTLAPLADDEFYLADLVAREVVDADGRGLGVVLALSSNGAQDLIDVQWRSPAGELHRWLLPVLPGFVLEVGDRIVVDPPAGMLPAPLEAEFDASEQIPTDRRSPGEPGGDR